MQDTGVCLVNKNEAMTLPSHS